MSDEEGAGAVEVDEEPASTRLPTQPGDLVAAKYEVERILGAGGMGIVVAAVHLDLQEPVAIKFMLPEVAASPAAANRFLREAQATSRLKSERIARLHDVGRLGDGTPFMVMELLEGETLDRVMDRERRMAVETIVDLVLQACEPLDEAHRMGIVHRDVKPENLFLAERPGEGPLVKVLDFGISKVQTSISITVGNGMMGTATYSSPEQLRSPSDVGPSADVWSLGVILFEGLTGTVPFGGASFAEICASVLHEVPARARDRRPDLPPGLDEVVGRCIARDDPSRITSMAELAGALAPFASEEGRALAARIVRRSSRRPDAAASIPPAASSPVPSAAVEPAASTAPAAPPATSPEDPAIEVEIRPSFAESITPLAMDHGLSAVPPPPAPRRRSRRPIAVAAVAALIGASAVAVVWRGGDVASAFAATGRPAAAVKVGPIARALATAAVAAALPRDVPPATDDDGGEAVDDARTARERRRAADARTAPVIVARAIEAPAPAAPPARRVAPPREAPRPVAPDAAPPAERSTGEASAAPTPPDREGVGGSAPATDEPEFVVPAEPAPPAASAPEPARSYPFGVVPVYP